jgi:hypothetical protein
MKAISLILVLVVVSLMMFGCKEAPVQQTTTQPQTQQVQQDTKTINQAVQSGDTTGCGDIQDPQLKESCIVNAYMSKAIQESNPDLCNNIQQEGIRTSCKDNAFLQKAMTQGDSKICSSIVSERIRVICTNNFV